MTDVHAPPDRSPESGPPASPLAEAIDGAVRRVSTVLVIAAAIVGLAVYARPGPPRYQAVAVGGQVVRIDTRTGSMIACEGQQCMIVVRRGQSISRKVKALPGPTPATPPPAAPAAEK